FVSVTGVQTCALPIFKENNPVAIEWAAKYEDEWTLHFSVVSGLDLSNDKVTIYNPYGYIENL
ncbi:MAG: hypothetical protein IK034_01945, partial [Bacilli bacterium]|nr:hypothetical protein [Bacilli bacterium]